MPSTYRVLLNAGKSGTHALQEVVPIARVQRPDVRHGRHPVLRLRDQVGQALC